MTGTGLFQLAIRTSDTEMYDLSGFESLAAVLLFDEGGNSTGKYALVGVQDTGAIREDVVMADLPGGRDQGKAVVDAIWQVLIEGGVALLDLREIIPAPAEPMDEASEAESTYQAAAQAAEDRAAENS